MRGNAEAGVEGLICGNAVCILFGRKGLDKNSVATMESNHRAGRLRHVEAADERDCPVAVWTVVVGAAGLVAETGAVDMK